MLDRRGFLVLGLTTLALPLRAQPRLVLTIQPLTPAPSDDDLQYVVKSVKAFFDLDVVTAPAEELPPSAYYLPRKRHRAEKILDVLEPRATLAHRREATVQNKIMGFTSGDISTTKGTVLDWGILGLGNIGGAACVVSRRRARTQVQLGKVAVHELGHTFGSDHCPVAGCLMNDARGTVKTVDAERVFCADTLALFRQRGAPVIEEPKPPW